MQSEQRTANNLQHLLNQVRWVTRTSVALSSAINADDIYSVLLSGLISPMGLGYSTAIVFEYDSAHAEMIGKFAIAIQSAEQQHELLDELQHEAAFLDQRRRELLERSLDDDSTGDDLRTLQLGSQWVTLFQRLGTDNDLTKSVQTLRFPVKRTSDKQNETIFQKTWHGGGPRIIETRRGNGTIPPGLQPLLAPQFALMPLRTSKGLRGVILLDRRLTNEPLTHEDVESLDWFATQGALALQNSELIGDLEKTYDELKTVDQLKSNFLSIISHELRTPLTAITGFIELLLNNKAGDVTEAQKSLLTRVAKNTGHLSNMVNDLIEIAEIKAEGMIDVSLLPVDPLNLLFSTLPKLEYRRRGNKVEIEPVFQDAVPNILCDARVLERIYFHLLDNAVKFSPTEETVNVEYSIIDREHLAIAIRDKGTGMPKDKLQRIFEEFYQIDNTLTRSHEGLGLGLAVTRLLVQATRGEIHVESTEGVGSKFTLVYPIADSE